MERIVRGFIYAGLFGIGFVLAQLVSGCIADLSDPLDQLDAADQYYAE